jgi:drug/metabolite transporter (DMT)-like permease
MKTKTWLALLSLYIIWGSTYLAILFAVETIPPFISAGIRFLISGAILFLWRWLAHDPMPTRIQWRSAAIVGTLLLLGGNGLVSWSEQLIPSGIAALLIGTVPLWLVLIEALRPGGTKASWQAILGLAIGFAGVLVLVGPAELTGKTQQFNFLGVLVCLIAAVLWSFGSIYSRSSDLPKSALMTTGMEMLAGSIGLFLVASLTGEWTHFSIYDISQKSFYGLIYLITIGSLVGFVSYAWLLKNAPVPLVATYAYVNPLVAILLGTFFANELLTPRMILAAIIIIGSVVFINTSGNKSKIPENEKHVPIAEKIG